MRRDLARFTEKPFSDRRPKRHRPLVCTRRMHAPRVYAKIRCTNVGGNARELAREKAAKKAKDLSKSKQKETGTSLQARKERCVYRAPFCSMRRADALLQRCRGSQAEAEGERASV